MFSIIIWNFAPAVNAFSYGDKIPRSPFLILGKNKSVLLPEQRKNSIFYFSLLERKTTSDTKDNDYFSTVYHSFAKTDISIYQVLLDSLQTGNIETLPSAIPLQSEIYQPVWDAFLRIKSNLVLLLDSCQIVRYFGEPPPFDDFSQLLERLGLDFSMPVNIAPDWILRQNILVAFDKNKDYTPSSSNINRNILFIFYRSICKPCGEDLLLKELNDLFLKNALPIDVFLIFQKSILFDKINYEKILSELNFKYVIPSSNTDPPPSFYKLFLHGNPFLVLFSQDHKFVKSAKANHMNEQLLLAFLNSVI